MVYSCLPKIKHLEHFSFHKKTGLKFHMPNRTVHSGGIDPTHGYCSCKKDTNEGYWGNNFVKWKGTFRLVWSKWTTFKAGPKYSSQTKPKWSVPFDVPTEISETLG